MTTIFLVFPATGIHVYIITHLDLIAIKSLSLYIICMIIYICIRLYIYICMYAYKHVEYSTVMRRFWAVRGMHIRDSTRILCELLQQAERQFRAGFRPESSGSTSCGAQ
jgi:hypothetical protein